MKNVLRLGVVGLVVLLGACAVDPDEIMVAEKTCETHGGVKFLYAFPKVEVFCKDGFIARNLKAGSNANNNYK